jgi:hypothetical protein
MCGPHDYRVLRYGDPHWQAPSRERKVYQRKGPPPQRICTIHGCDAPTFRKHMCQAHAVAHFLDSIPARSEARRRSTVAVTLSDAKLHLNIEATDHTDDTELQFFVDVAVEWVSKRVPDLMPAPVRLATLELVRHLWDTQRGPAVGSLDDAPTPRVGTSYAVPNRVTELLAPYMLGPIDSQPWAGSVSLSPSARR